MNPQQVTHAFRGYVLNGDEALFEAVYRDVYPRLRRMTRRCGAGTTDVDDIVQATLLIALEKRHTFDATRCFVAWVSGILFGEVRNHWRRAVARKPESTHLAVIGDPLQKLVDKEVHDMVHREVTQLEPRYQRVLQARMRDERRPKEIAQDLGESESTVRTQLWRGMGVLRDRLAHLNSASSGE